MSSGQAITEEYLASLEPKQRNVLRRFGEAYEQMRTLEAKPRPDPHATLMPTLSPYDFAMAADEELAADALPLRHARLEEEIKDYLRQAIDLGLGHLGLIQRTATRLGMGPYLEQVSQSQPTPQ